MVGGLDTKDRAILYHLDRDARQPISKISKKVQLNREVARYRIDRMMKKGIIQKFLTFVTIPTSGSNVTTVFFRFQDTSATDEEAVIKYLNEKKSVIWLASMDGRFNLGFTLSTTSTPETAQFLDEFREKFGQFLSDFHMNNVVRARRIPRKYLLDEQPVEEKRPDEIIVPKADLDKLDRIVLSSLGEDGRMTAVEIAKRAGVSADAVADRISKLRKKGIITSIGLVLDNIILNRRLFRSFITFHNIASVEKKFLDYCWTYPNAIQVKRVLGPWEYEVDLELQDETELRRAQAAFKGHFKDAVRSTSYVSIYKIHKFNLASSLGEVEQIKKEKD